MIDKIEKLTPKQEASLYAYRDEMIALGRSTELANRPEAERALKLMYGRMGWEEPKFWWVDGPSAFLNIRAIVTSSKKLVKQAMKRLDDGLQMPANVPELVGLFNVSDKAVNKARENYDWSFFWGCYESYWQAFYSWPDKNLRRMHSDEDRELLDAWLTLSANVSIWAPHDGVVFVSERPESYAFDDNDLLHSETGPAIRCRDGWEVYCWHGVNIPGEWIKDKPPTASEAITWQNMEQRRAACELVGWDRILEQLNARVINEGSTEFVGTLLEADLPDVGTERFLKVRCATGRIFALPVPPETETAEAAQRWLNYIPDNVPFIPEIMA